MSPGARMVSCSSIASAKTQNSTPAVEPFVGLRFGPLWGCLCPSEMDPETPDGRTRITKGASRAA